MSTRDQIAVVIPCRNEADTVGTVVRDFAAALPGARIHVFDNASTEDTAARAEEAGAEVHWVGRVGKGHVVRKMFSDVEAEIYVMVDGDDTYAAAAAPELIDRLRRESLDMMIGARITDPPHHKDHRPGHRVGIRVFGWLYAHLFDLRFDDVFSGYRVFTRRFVKSFPATTTGFDVETELIAHAFDLRVDVAEAPTHYRPRPSGEGSKLATIGDGLRILRSAVRLYRQTRPLRFYGGMALLITAFDLVAGIPLLVEYLDSGLVPRFPTAILLAALQVIAVVFLAVGLVGEAISRQGREQRRTAFLAIPRAPS